MQTANVTQFIEENLKTIFAYSLSRVSNKEDAEDLTNDIVLAILQSADKLKTPEAFYGYVWGIAANTYRKFMRKRSKSEKEIYVEALQSGEGTEVSSEGCGYDCFAVSEDFAEDLAESLAIKENTAKLRREIALLSYEHRECTVAYYFRELSCADIAKELNISLEMVKYYLFKTRKILKEGISMEREFGEKSFKPEPFEFVTIFEENYNREYSNLFKRKLPGQILLSAYYTPMSVRELAIELGVASVYLEDELTLLEKYRLVEKNPHGKYLTNLVIFTDEYTKEFIRETKKFAVPALKEILVALKEKLGEIRAINRYCESLSEERLLWSVLWPTMMMGNHRFTSGYPQYSEKGEIYQGACGINYGTVNHAYEGRYGCYAFAGYAGIDDSYYAVAADFGVLPEENRFFTGVDEKAFTQKIYDTVDGKIKPEFIIFTEAEENIYCSILGSVAEQMAELYDKLFICACDIMRQHAPKQVEADVEKIMFQTLLFRTVGLFGGFAVDSGELLLPQENGPVAFYVRENTKEAEATVNQNVMSR